MSWRGGDLQPKLLQAKTTITSNPAVGMTSLQTYHTLIHANVLSSISSSHPSHRGCTVSNNQIACQCRCCWSATITRLLVSNNPIAGQQFSIWMKDLAGPEVQAKLWTTMTLKAGQRIFMTITNSLVALAQWYIDMMVAGQQHLCCSTIAGQIDCWPAISTMHAEEQQQN